MDSTTNAPQIDRALAQQLGHEPPFSDEEIGGATTLLVQGLVGAAGLSRCTGLRRLTIFASDLEDLSFLAQLPHLTALSVYCSSVRDLQAAATSSVEDLDLCFTCAEDLTPILQMTALRHLRLWGNPWDAARHDDWIAQLRATPVPRWGRPPVLDLCLREEWALTRSLWDQGIPLCFSRIDGAHPVLVRPGRGTYKGAAVDHVEISEGLIRRHLGIVAADTTAQRDADTFLHRFDAGRDRALLGPSLDFFSHRIIGDAAEAAGWIRDSPFGEEHQAALLRLVHRFPSLGYFQERAEALSRIAREEQITFPSWFELARQTLCGPLSGGRIRVQFDAFDRDVSPRAEELAGIWYRLSLAGYANTRQREVLAEQCQAFVIGEWVEGARSSLAIRLLDNNPRIYEFAEADVWDNLSDERPPQDAFSPAFESYASMLGHIIAIQLEEAGETILALPTS